MYAVIKAGGHQYRVQKGDELRVDFLKDVKEGDKVTFDQVVMVGGDKAAIGTPTVAGAKVEATVKKQDFDPKVKVFKYKRRKNYKRTRGHKQPVTLVEISEISQ
jgi:large subunit ribosomal protein L21